MACGRNRRIRWRKDLEMNVKLQVFEGPLDLLLHLIDKNKVDIYDIPIVEITDQYMEQSHRINGFSGWSDQQARHYRGW